MDEHGNLTEDRCDTFSAKGTDYCWQHLRHVFGLILRQTNATQEDGRKYPELGVYAYWSDHFNVEKGDIPNDQIILQLLNMNPL